jgi:hypothetical protein
MDIRVVEERSTPTLSEPDYVRVQVFPDPEQDTMTLATIERVVCKPDEKRASLIRRVKKLIENQPMTRDAALGFARLYAARKRIKLVLTAEESEAREG